MIDYTLQQLSIHLCILTVMAFIVRLRQDKMEKGWVGFTLTLGMASLAISSLQKTFARIDGDHADLIDVWQELSLFLIVFAKIIIEHRKKIA